MNRLYSNISPNMFVYGGNHGEQEDEIVRLQDRRASHKRSLEPWDTLMDKTPTAPFMNDGLYKEKSIPDSPKHRAKHRRIESGRAEKEGTYWTGGGHITFLGMINSPALPYRDRRRNNEQSMLKESIK